MSDGGICLSPKWQVRVIGEYRQHDPRLVGHAPEAPKNIFNFFYFPYENGVFFEENRSNASLIFAHEKLIRMVSR